MFAGRYVWWLITATAGFFLFLIGFDGIAWFTRSISNCTGGGNSCLALDRLMLGQIKPLLVCIAAMVLVLAVIVRIAYLRFFPLWFLPVPVWAAATAGVLSNYLPLWHGGADPLAVLHLLPPAAFALAALAMFLAFPLEEDEDPAGTVPPIGILAGFAAFACTLQVLATATGMPLVLARTFHLVEAANLLGSIQADAATFLLIDGGNRLPGVIMVMIFALALALRIVRREQLASGV